VAGGPQFPVSIISDYVEAALLLACLQVIVAYLKSYSMVRSRKVLVNYRLIDTIQIIITDGNTENEDPNYLKHYLRS